MRRSREKETNLKSRGICCRIRPKFSLKRKSKNWNSNLPHPKKILKLQNPNSNLPKKMPKKLPKKLRKYKGSRKNRLKPQDCYRRWRS